MRTPLIRSLQAMLVCATALAIPASSVGAQVGYEPTHTRAIVSPLALQNAPLNTNVIVVLKSQKDQVVAEWPAELPATAMAGYAVARLTTDEGVDIPATVEVRESLAGVRVDITPTAALQPQQAYTVRVAAAVPLPSSQPGEQLPVTNRIETRFTTGDLTDTENPTLSTASEVTLRTATSDLGRGDCAGYSEQLLLRTSDLADAETATGSMRVFLAPYSEDGSVPDASSVLMLTGSNIGSFTVSSCDGNTLPWGQVEVTSAARSMLVWAEDVAGHKSTPIVVYFPPGPSDLDTWISTGQVLALGEALPTIEPAVDTTTAEGADEPAAGEAADEEGQSSNSTIIIFAILALAILGGIVLMKKRR